jgi:hypothetical protein
MVQKMRASPSSFRGKCVVFVHTGGIFGLYGSRYVASSPSMFAPTETLCV